MAEQVGSIYYNVTLDTSKMIDGQRAIQRNLDKTSGGLDAFDRRLTSVAKAVASYAAALYAVDRIDAFTKMNAQLKIATESASAFAAAQADVRRIAQESQSDISAVATLYARISSATKDLGITQQRVNDITRAVALSLKVSGATAQEAASATLQLSQAFGSGVLRGEEFNSVNEAAPRLMQALAESIGVPRGQLRGMAEDGKLTAKLLADELPKALQKLQAEASSISTIGGAFQEVKNELTLLIGEMDKASGSSNALTGITRGLSDVLDGLVGQIASANREASAIGANDGIETWANESRTVLSYVADAADMVWQTLSVLGRNVAFVFKSVGAEIGGIGAQIRAVMAGDFKGAAQIGEDMAADAKRRRAELDAADAKTLSREKLAGQQMREAWAYAESPQGKADALRVSGGTRGGPGMQSSATPAATTPTAKPSKKSAGSSRAAADGDSLGEFMTDKANAQSERLSREAARVEEYAKGIVLEQADPAEQVRARFQARLDVLNEALANELLNEQLHAQAVIANQQAMNTELKRIDDEKVKKDQEAQALRLQGMGQMFGSMADLTKEFAGEQSGIYKAMFAVSKAFAIADSIIKIQQGIASAAALPFPANLGAMASVASATAGIVSTIQGAQFGGGRLYGGPVSAGSMYRVNENGKPEMFTAANGSQYMLPSKSGRVTAANKVGPAGAVIQLSPTYHIGDGVSEGAVYAAVQMGNAQLKRDIIQTLQTMRVL